jgi:mono/diheme cytochrome c family protein
MKDVKGIFRDDAEPTMRQGTVFLPMWLTGLLGVLVYLAFNYIDLHGGDYNPLVYEPFRSTNELSSIVPKDESVILYNRGKIIYGNICAGCHQPTGAGNAGQAPPLAGSEWVLAQGGPNRVIRIPMAGLTGPIKVNGVDWALSMPAFAGPGMMSDEDLAAVVTYIRSSWGNKAPPVTLEEVQKVRADVMKNHPDQQYTAEELLKLPEKVP